MNEIAEFLASLGALIAAFTALIVVWRNSKSNEQRDQKIQQIYVNTNDRLDAMSDLVASAFEKGSQSERDRTSDNTTGETT